MGFPKTYFFLFIIGFALAPEFKSSAQDPFFSQIYNVLPYYNPAQTGSSGGGRFYASTRNEYEALNISYQTVYLGGDYYVKSIKSGIGVNFLYDKDYDGQLKTRSFNLSFAHHIETGGGFTIQPGVQLGYTAKQLSSFYIDTAVVVPFYGKRYSYPIPEDPVDKRIGIPEVSLGVLLYDQTFFTGLAAHHLASTKVPYISNDRGRFPLRFVYHLGYNLGFSEKVSMVPTIFFTMQDKMMVLMMNAAVNFEGFVIAAGWYKNFDTDGFALKTKIGARYENVLLGYNYDFYFSDLYGELMGAHEISLNVFVGGNEQKKMKSFEVLAF